MGRSFLRKLTDAFFILGVILLTVMSLITYRQIEELIEANHWVTHSYAVIEKSNQILFAVLYMDSRLQINQGGIDLKTLMNATTTQVNELRLLTGDNLRQKQRLDKLDPLVKEKMAYFQRIMQKPVPATMLVTKSHTDKVIQSIHEIQAEELQLLKNRDLISHQKAAATRLMILMVVVIGDLLLILTFLLIHYQNRRLRLAERKQNELKTRYTRIIDSSKDLIAALDTQFNFIAFNQAYAQKFQELFDVQIKMGANLIDALAGYSHKELIVSVWRRALEGEEYVINIPLGKKEPQDSFYEVTFSVIRNKSGTIQAATHIMRDITARMKIDNLKSEFVSIVSHELRTPLTSIRGSLSLMNKQFGTLTEPMHKLLNIASNNCDRLIILINDLLDIDKLEKGKMQFHFQHVDINQIAEDAVLGNASYGEKFSVSIVFEKPQNPIMIEADPQRVRQVLDNFISNAIKFSRPHAAVTVIVSVVNNMVRVAVKNDGEGVPEAFHQLIFQKFAQADSSATRQHGGTGLGLSISKAIIESHQGKIGFTSQPDQETVFYFELPLFLNVYQQTR